MRLYDLEGSGINPRMYPDIASKGYAVERFGGQTHVALPQLEKLVADKETVVCLVGEVFHKYDLARSDIYFCSDGIMMSLPPIRTCRLIIDPVEAEEKFSENPTLVFPDWYLPDHLARKVLELGYK